LAEKHQAVVELAASVWAYAWTAPLGQAVSARNAIPELRGGFVLAVSNNANSPIIIHGRFSYTKN